VKLSLPFTIKSSDEMGPVFDAVFGELQERVPKRRISLQARTDLKVCFVEAVANAIAHGKEIECPGFVTGRFFLDAKNIGFDVVDHGEGFDINAIPVPDLNLPKSSGRGVFMMKQLSDSVRYAVHKNENRLTLKLHTAPSGGSRELDLLYDLSEAIVAKASLDEVYQIILDQALEIFNVERASILVYDDRIKRLKLVASRGIPHEIRQSATVRKGEGVSGYVFQHGRPLLIEDIDENKRGIPKQGHYKSRSFISAPMICSPMRIGEKPLGVINLTDRVDGKKFSKKDLKLLSTIANQAMACLTMRGLLDEVKDGERLRQEIDTARRIQASYLPQQPPELARFDLAGRCEMAQSVGGDYFDYIMMGRFLYLIVADVSGHDMSSAMTMVSFRSQLRAMLHHETEPGAILTLLNRSLYADLKRSEQFVSCLLVKIDTHSGAFALASAGHYPPLFARSDFKLVDPGLVVGVDPEETYVSTVGTLVPGETLLLFTDGVTECMNRQGEVFGMRRLERCLALADGIPAAALANRVIDEVLDFRSTKRPLDDVTVVALRHKPDAPAGLAGS
jgi:sigma-B regulation protein RsbU (phosphoserine phosphatase)